MYSRIDHNRSNSAGTIPQQNIPMPHIPSNNPGQSYFGTDEEEHYNYGDLSEANHDEFEEHDISFDPEAHRRSYYSDPYQPSLQNLPLISRHSSHSQFATDEQPPFLQSHGASDSYHSNPETVEAFPGTSHELKRSKSTKPVQLFHGNLVLDCPVPPKLLGASSNTASGHDEFTHMRYTAATCDPADFTIDRFTLRQQLFAQPRHTELLIVVTMYNEDDVLFARTMTGVFQNIEYMCSGKGKSSGSWGKEGWKKIVVCIVSDGRAKINPRTKAVLTGLGAYQNGVAKQTVNEKDVTAHIYEYTTRCGIAVKDDVVETRPGTSCPVQLLFCLKEKNQKKINSHRWALQAFGQVLQPNVVVLLDAGTRPGKSSIYQLWRAFDLDPMCGGACGEIKAMLGKSGKNLLNPLVATQNFEYKMSNILDKPMESAFGFISVLPGAFSAYRFVALSNNAKGEGPLEKYFLGEKMHSNAGIFTANMYLAEDRILCFELVSKRKAHWVLTYVCTATGETDVPDTMTELILQRRRWLNGSFFAAVYALAHSFQIFRSSHTMVRKIFFLIEFLYQLISMVFAWFAVGNFFLVFQILTSSLGAKELLDTFGRISSVVVQWIYLASLVTCFVLSLGNRPQGSNKFYMAMVITWAVIMVYLTAAAIYITYEAVKNELEDGVFTLSKLLTNDLFFTLIVSLLSTYVLWIFASLLFRDPWHIFTSTAQYILLSPTYINVINVYAFCNTHDITWGTKGDDKAEKLPAAAVKSDGSVNVDMSFDDGDLNAMYTSELQKFAAHAPEEKKEANASDVQEDYYKGFRSTVVLTWMFCNAALVAIILNSGGLSRLSTKVATDEEVGQSYIVKTYLKTILWSVAFLSAFKFAGASWYLIGRIFRS